MASPDRPADDRAFSNLKAAATNARRARGRAIKAAIRSTPAAMQLSKENLTAHEKRPSARSSARAQEEEEGSAHSDAPEPAALAPHSSLPDRHNEAKFWSNAVGHGATSSTTDFTRPKNARLSANPGPGFPPRCVRGFGSAIAIISLPRVTTLACSTSRRAFRRLSSVAGWNRKICAAHQRRP